MKKLFGVLSILFALSGVVEAQFTTPMPITLPSDAEVQARLAQTQAENLNATACNLEGTYGASLPDAMAMFIDIANRTPPVTFEVLQRSFMLAGLCDAANTQYVDHHGWAGVYVSLGNQRIIDGNTKLAAGDWSGANADYQASISWSQRSLFESGFANVMWSLGDNCYFQLETILILGQ